MLLKKLFVFIALFSSWSMLSFAQSNADYWYIEPTYLSAWIMPMHTGFPDAGLQNTVMVGFGKVRTDSIKPWVPFYNFPHVGVDVAFSDYGHSQELGQSISLLPYLVFNGSHKLYSSSHYKFGLGFSYFNTRFDKDDNPNNWSISSPLNWTFMLQYYYSLRLTEKTLWNIGAGVMHSSNAHTKIPNFGLNTFLLSTSFQFYSKPVPKTITRNKSKTNSLKDYYLSLHLGSGIHKLADARWPQDSETKQIYSLAVYGSKVYKNSFRLKAGVTYRFYNSYYDYIREKELDPYTQNPIASASNVFVSVGGEMLLGHVGVEGEIGVNLFKPFYDEFNNQFENGNKGLGHTLKMYFSTRLGLKFYALNANVPHKYNFFAATHINANMGAADYWGFSTGIIRKL